MAARALPHTVLRDALWQAGYAVDTVETAAEWGRVPALVAGIEGALGGALDDEGERAHVITHLSHVYPSGSSVYTTFVFRLAPEPAGTLRRWRVLKGAASAAPAWNGQPAWATAGSAGRARRSRRPWGEVETYLGHCESAGRTPSVVALRRERLMSVPIGPTRKR